MNDLVLIPEPINAVEIFTGEKLDTILLQIQQKATDFVSDATTAAGRKEIAAMAYKVARSKTTLDDLGKDLVSGWKEKAKLVDAARKKSRDFLDDLKDTVRKPLTVWELEEEARVEEEKMAAEFLIAWDEAHTIHAIYIKEKELAAREAEMIRKEQEAKAKAEAEAAEKKAKEDAERAEKERVEREAEIRKEEAEKARREAAEAIARAEREKVASEERAKLEAEQAEKNRLVAEQRAKEDQEAAVKKAQEQERARIEAEQKAKADAEAKAKALADKLAADKKHQSTINKAALCCFTENGFTEEQGKAIITLIAAGKIKHIAIQY